jgi:oligoendopeptidase F
VKDILIPLRNEIATDRTWNAPSIFESVDAWDAAFEDLSDGLHELTKYKGRLGDDPSTLVNAIGAVDRCQRKLGKIIVYALMSHSVDTTVQAAVERFSKAQSLASRMTATAAFFEPEVLSIGKGTLQKWMEEKAGLAVYEHYFDNLFRKQAHVRSSEVEELLGMLIDPFQGVAGTARMLMNADFNFPPATASDGAKIPLTHGTLVKILAGKDRQARRSAWENYTDLFLAYKNALAINLETSIKQNVFLMHARGHKSTLEAALFDYNIPVQVFHNLIDTFKESLPTWHRYWAIRRQALAVDELHPYDIWAPLTQDRPQIPYEQAVEWICQGLAPLGEAYVATVRNGCLRDRWVDVYPNKGKRAGAFSTGRPGTYPFILMSYGDTIFNLSTLAHELGHSMHSYLTWQNQPIVYCDYSLFVAEVASNFHQAMVRDHLLKANSDPAFQISVIEEAMNNFHRYFLIMPTLARFELEMHESVERGGGLTADSMIDRLAELFAEAYGDEMHFDRERLGIQWAIFSHLYVDYYVYQYATGISGAHALAKRILAGEEGAVEEYLTFLKAGSSLYPLDALRGAGVDLTKPDAVKETFAVLADMVDRLEELVS